MEHHTRPEAQIPDTLAKIAGLFQINPDLGEVVLRAYAALRGLSPEALRSFLTPPRRERAREAFQAAYLRHFAENLPRYPYATDDPKEGVRIYKRENALKRVHVQVGHYPHAVLRLVVDVDLPWPQVEERIHALPPSLVLVNPRSGHFHAWYELDPIPLKPPPGREGSLKGALALLAEVEALLEAYYGADPGYNGLLSRNPFLHPPEWTWGGGKRWSLRDLHRELRGLLPSGTRRRVDPGLASYGRNNALFDRLRAEAYAHVALFRGVPGGEEAFRAWVEQRAHALNQALFRDHPKGPLDPREVHHTAKSVAKWTYRNYRGARVYPVSSTGRPDRSRLSPQARALIPPLQGQELQEAVQTGASLGGRKRGSRRRQEAEEKLTEALKRLQARGERITGRALAREAGVDKKTASKWLKRMRE
ncbi:primase C-terminal domain-containing protein [Thermus thermophilus]|uniref:primase C-terminal domain-containing protein n=1 Tax=Thermus thermophilus TaxID=274 RepID=UPI0001660005|nr:primase C-terminal domain-containing protein [Thermus thermophilus]